MKSFATLCLLAGALAIRLQKPEDGEDNRPCLEGASDEQINNAIEGINRGLREEAGYDSDRAEKAVEKIKEGVRAGATCAQWEAGFREEFEGNADWDSSDVEMGLKRVAEITREKTGGRGPQSEGEGDCQGKKDKKQGKEDNKRPKKQELCQ